MKPTSNPPTRASDMPLWPAVLHDSGYVFNCTAVNTQITVEPVEDYLEIAVTVWKGSVPPSYVNAEERKRSLYELLELHCEYWLSASSLSGVVKYAKHQAMQLAYKSAKQFTQHFRIPQMTGKFQSAMPGLRLMSVKRVLVVSNNFIDMMALNSVAVDLAIETYFISCDDAAAVLRLHHFDIIVLDCCQNSSVNYVPALLSMNRHQSALLLAIQPKVHASKCIASRVDGMLSYPLKLDEVIEHFDNARYSRWVLQTTVSHFSSAK
ncbi:hypothetical protein [Bowmanella denitrificans]|uniref:hypothetical protein n=1 Tax=Bowmanella denitrificans TaxID=366582 RepID=UPI0031CDB58D